MLGGQEAAALRVQLQVAEQGFGSRLGRGVGLGFWGWG